MAEQKSDTQADRHQQARDLAEQALEEYSKGDKKKGDEGAKRDEP